MVLADVTIIDQLGLIRARANTESSVKVIIETKSQASDKINLNSVNGENSSHEISKDINQSKIVFGNVKPGEWKIEGDEGSISKVTIVK